MLSIHLPHLCNTFTHCVDRYILHTTHHLPFNHFTHTHTHTLSLSPLLMHPYIHTHPTLINTPIHTHTHPTEAEPSESELEVHTKVAAVLIKAREMLEELRGYQGAGAQIREVWLMGL